MSEKKLFFIDDTNFKYSTNFSGNPENDKFGDSRRKANILIPNPQQAKDIEKAGFKVRHTKPGPKDDPDTFQPEHFVEAILQYRTKTGEPVQYPPKVYLVVGDEEPRLLTEDTVFCLDSIRVKNVNVVLNSYEYDRVLHKENLRIQTMYVEQKLDDDPYAARYRRRTEKED